ncbi:hypothetical protein D1007_18375 [Hordeum vulgare]|nr:hypothetical protein D1007_18375 [Hordeum vulgare]KAI4993848.1 hypothetical protein ZWY2020_008161 [Hordeum vulgare]
MASSPTFVSAPSCRNGDRPVVSVLGISSGSDSPGCVDAREISSRPHPEEGEDRAPASRDTSGGCHRPSEPAPSSKKSLWRRRHDRELLALQSWSWPPSPPFPPAHDVVGHEGPLLPMLSGGALSAKLDQPHRLQQVWPGGAQFHRLQATAQPFL